MSHYEIRQFTFEHKGGVYENVKIGAGRRVTKRIVPPAGEAYAFKVDTWDTMVEITVSPTGRSVQVFVNGKKVA
jgi:hypothetical protein